MYYNSRRLCGESEILCYPSYKPALPVFQWQFSVIHSLNRCIQVVGLLKAEECRKLPETAQCFRIRGSSQAQVLLVSMHKSLSQMLKLGLSTK